MPIALERGGEIERLGFDREIRCSPIFDSPAIAGDMKGLRSPPGVKEAEEAAAAAEEEESSTCTSASTSSIGKNSESFGSDDEDLAAEKEVESKYKGPLSALESLEEALPIRRGISSFYNGKSKSFASLSDAMLSCSSIKDLGKQENAYTRKRRNLLASKNFHLKSSPNPLKGNGGAISKRPPSNGRNMQALAMAMSNNSSIEEDHKQQYHLLPPLHPPGKTSAAGSSLVRSSSPQYRSFPMRSFSLTDLQAMTNSKS